MNNINLNLMVVVSEMFRQMNNKQLVVDTEDGHFYVVESETAKGGVEVRPLSFHDNSPIFHFNKSRLFFLTDLLNPEKIGKNRENIGKLLERYRNTGRDDIGMMAENIGQAPEQNRNAGGIISDSHRAVIGKSIVDLPAFSQLYTGEIASVSLKFELLADKIFRNTAKKTTIRKTVEDYNTAKQLAREGNLFELKEMVLRLEGRVKSQEVTHSLNEKMAGRQRLKRLAKIAAIASVPVLAVTVYIFTIVNKNVEENLNVPAVQITLDSQLVYNKIAEYQKKNDTTLSPWRTKEIVKYLVAKPVAEMQIIKKIDSLKKVKKFEL